MSSFLRGKSCAAALVALSSQPLRRSVATTTGASRPFTWDDVQTYKQQEPPPEETFFQLIRPDGSPRTATKTTTTSSKARGGAGSVEEDALAVRMLQCMMKVRAMDRILFDAQRHGRIPFYLTCEGEEGAVVGAAAGLEDDDEVFSQYREHAVLMWRGFSYLDFMQQCFANRDEPGRGRQMPVHYGSERLHFQTVSSTVATQVSNAVGAAFALKHREGSRRIAATFFGDGGSSEGDCHAAMNFAAALKCPVLFVCRNNGWAISTPVAEQFAGGGPAAKASAYGIPSAVVDGNDAVAVQVAVHAARERCRSSGEPVFLELKTHRIGPHSTSDDSSKYRTAATTDQARQNDPIDRLRRFVLDRSLWSESEADDFLQHETSAAIVR